MGYQIKLLPELPKSILGDSTTDLDCNENSEKKSQQEDFKKIWGP